MVSLAEISWAAGFFDGDGYIGGHRQIEVIQKDKEPLERMKRLTGGSIYKFPNRPYYRWRLSGPRARGFLMTIYPLLTSRRQAAARRFLRH